MARKRASMREGPLAELFRATEAAQRAQRDQPEPEEPTAVQPAAEEPERPRHLEPAAPVQQELSVAPEDVTLEATVEHVYDFEAARPESGETDVPRRPTPEPARLSPAAEPAAAPRETPAAEAAREPVAEPIAPVEPAPVAETYTPPAKPP